MKPLKGQLLCLKYFRSRWLVSDKRLGARRFASTLPSYHLTSRELHPTPAEINISGCWGNFSHPSLSMCSGEQQGQTGKHVENNYFQRDMMTINQISQPNCLDLKSKIIHSRESYKQVWSQTAGNNSSDHSVRWIIYKVRNIFCAFFLRRHSIKNTRQQHSSQRLGSQCPQAQITYWLTSLHPLFQTWPSTGAWPPYYTERKSKVQRGIVTC